MQRPVEHGRGTLRRTLAIAVAALALSVAAPGTTAHAASDPVTASVRHAASSGTIPAAQRRQYLGIWRASARTQRRLARRGQGMRAGAVADSRAIVVDLALRGRLSADRLPAVLANVRATTWVMNHARFPRHEQRIRVPFDSIVYAYYDGVGVQAQPLFTFAQANVLYSIHADAGMQRIVRRMEQLAVRRNGLLTWEYYFPYAGGAAPWTSAMAQATAVQVLARTYERTGDERYLALAHEALQAFRRPSRRGGVMSREGSGRWYLLYSFNPRQRVLNGHLQALIGLYDYYRISRDEEARTLVNEGIAGVLPMMHRFDTGAWSRYQLGQEADLGYHDLMTSQLTKLGTRTGIVQFSDLAHRFASYRVTPPRITVPVRRMRSIYPVSDGFRDHARLRFRVDKQASVALRIVDRRGGVVRTMRGDYGRGSHTVAWDGRTDSGRIARAGAYVVRFTAVDIIGNRRRGQLTRPIVVKHDTTRPRVLAASLRSRGLHASTVRVQVRDPESPWVDVRFVAGGRTLGTMRVHGRGRVRLPHPIRTLLGSRMVLIDTSGNRTVARPWAPRR